MVDAFVYDFDNTPKVTDISQTKLDVVGNQLVNISGTFSKENIKIFIGSKQAQVVSSTSDSVVIKTPSNEPGFYPLVIPIGSYGNAKY